LLASAGIGWAEVSIVLRRGLDLGLEELVRQADDKPSDADAALPQREEKRRRTTRKAQPRLGL
jgi:hypothetical protein